MISLMHRTRGVDARPTRRAAPIWITVALAAASTLTPEALASTGIPADSFTNLVPHGPQMVVTPGTGESYVARATLPLSDGFADNALCPFGLRRGDTVYPAQWSPVSWAPDGELAVVELAAEVDRLPSDGDQPVAFDLVRVSPGFGPGLPLVPADSLTTAIQFGRTLLRVTDVFGNQFYSALSQSPAGASTEIEVLGRAKGVFHTRGPLMRITGPGGSVERAGGTLAWFTFHSGSSAVELDLRWHNSTIGTPQEMAPDMLFEKVELLLPPGWNAAVQWPYPEFGQTLPAGTGGLPWTVVELIRDGATPHVVRQRGHLTWRLTLWPAGQEHDAMDRAEQRGWGVVRGADGGWRDPDCAGWQAQGTPLPDLSAWESALGSALGAQRAELESDLASGDPFLYAGVGRMGPYHSFGVAYGGMTGGSEIEQTPGVDLISSGSLDGLWNHRAMHRMVLDRQYGWVYDASGRLVVADDLVQTDGSLPVRVRDNDFIDLTYHDDLGFSDVPAVFAAHTPRPSYEGALLGTNPYNGLDQHDAQHGIRATRIWKTLIWAANDRMARHDLAAQAALWQMQFHHGKGERLDELYRFAQSHPGVGGGFGRGEAWMTDAIAHWHATTRPSERGALDPWFDRLLVTLERMRTPMGVFQGLRDGKVVDYHQFGGKYAVMQWYEHGISLHAIAALRAGWAPDAQRRARLGALLLDGALAIWRHGWIPGTDGTWDQQAVAWVDPGLPAFAGAVSTPADGFGGGPSHSQLPAAMGNAWPLADGAQRAELQAMASALMGSANPLGVIGALPASKLQLTDRAPLLARLQLAAAP